LKFQSEWEQSFSDWTINHRAFHLALRDIYKFPTFAGWLLEHKANCDQIQAKDGFMAALRYDIQLRTNAFAHRVVVNGDPSVPDISVLRTDIAESCYAEARNFDKLGFRDINPYALGGPRSHLDPLTGALKSGKHPFTKTNQQQYTSIAPQGQPGYGFQQPTHNPQVAYSYYQSQQQQVPYYQSSANTQNTLMQRQNEPRGQRGGGYKGKNFVPNYQDHRKNGAPGQNQAGNQMVLSSQS
jgi:hypothetical protein